jgi:LacI family transcriptional regulator
MGRINQQRLAQELKVSQTTVSRSLANHPAINAETKAMVLEAAARMGYAQPMKPVRSVREAATGAVIRVMITIPEGESGPSETHQEVLRGIADCSSRREATLDVIYQDPSKIDETALLRRIRTMNWKGLILIHPAPPEVVKRLATRTTCVSVIEKYPHLMIDSINVDQGEAIQRNVSLLKANGHRRIGFFTWKYPLEAPWVYQRFGAFVEALYRLGLEFDPDLCLNLDPRCPLNPEEAASAAADLVRGRRASAFVCAADHQGYKLMSSLQAHGLEVPSDVSLTGFDGITPYPGQNQLTTIRVPYVELGRSASHQLYRRLEHPSAPRRELVIDGDFIEGETVAAPLS